MAKKRKKPAGTGFGSAAIDALSGFLDALETGGPITVREVRVDLLPPTFSAREVRGIRDAMGVSQTLFARLLAVSPELVRKWESGTRVPRGVHGRLLQQVAVDPAGWMKQVIASAETFRRRRAG